MDKVAELKLVGEVRTLRVEPTDVIIIEADMAVSAEETQQLIRLFQEATGLPNRVMVLCHAKVRTVKA